MAIDSINNKRSYYYTFTPQEARYNENADKVFAAHYINFKAADAQTQDTFEKSSQVPETEKDDGRIGFWGAIKNIGKGAAKFFTGMVCDENGEFSIKQALKTAGMIAGIGLATFIPVLGPLVIPALCIYGVAHGGINVINGVETAMNATTDAEAELAWEEIGSGATEGILSAVGYRATGGIKTAFGKSKTQFMSIKNRFSKSPEHPIQLAEKTNISEATSAENTTATCTPEEVAEICERTRKQIEKSREARVHARANVYENMPLKPEDIEVLNDMAEYYNKMSFDSKLIGKDPNPASLSEVEVNHLQKFRSFVNQFEKLLEHKKKFDPETFKTRKNQIAQEWLKYCKDNNLYTDALKSWNQNGRQLIKHYFFKFIEDPSRLETLEIIMLKYKQEGLTFDISSMDTFSASTKNLLKYITEKTSEDISPSKVKRYKISDDAFVEQFKKMEKCKNGDFIETTYSYMGIDSTGILIASTGEDISTIMLTNYTQFKNRIPT